MSYNATGVLLMWSVRPAYIVYNSLRQLFQCKWRKIFPLHKSTRCGFLHFVSGLFGSNYRCDQHFSL